MKTAKPSARLLKIIFACAILITLPAAGLRAKEQFELNRFIPAATCADCHGSIFSQWENSLHSLSHKDPVYSKVALFLRKGLTHEGEIKEAEACVKCHTPVGVITGFPEKLSDDLSKTPEIATNGIQCDYCHTAVNISQMYNNGLVLEPGHGEDAPGIKHGPFDDAKPDFHETAFSKLHTESRICGTCHNVKHVAFGTDLETTYTEWENSPYNAADPEKKITCQGCHMFQRPGIPATGSTERPQNPGAATDYSDERPHIFTHYFVGANAGVPKAFGSQEKAAMARERLENAARLSVDTPLAGQKELTISITNSGAGHSIPTGVGDLRQVWLEISITGKANQILYQSGVLNEKQELPDDALIFKTTFGDGKGNEVINIARARQVLSDNRIKAKETRNITLDLPKVLEKGALISVRLLYRSMSQKLLNMVPGGPFPDLPVIEMAKEKKQI